MQHRNCFSQENKSFHTGLHLVIALQTRECTLLSVYQKSLFLNEIVDQFQCAVLQLQLLPAVMQVSLATEQACVQPELAAVWLERGEQVAACSILLCSKNDLQLQLSAQLRGSVITTMNLLRKCNILIIHYVYHVSSG